MAGMIENKMRIVWNGLMVGMTIIVMNSLIL